MRRPLVAANWKMHKHVQEAVAYARDFPPLISTIPNVDVVLAPPFLAVPAVVETLRNDGHNRIRVAAQNVHFEPQGAFTGEVSLSMLQASGVAYVIVGHSERRQLFHETDDSVNKKTRAAIAAGVIPIVCVGETLEERESGKTEDVITRQVETGLQDIGNNLGGLIVAYEPVWAIGTGKTATPEQAQDVHHFIRELLQKQFGEAKAGATRIQYGGSVKPDNAKALMSQPDIDGGLIGGASLETRAFVEIVKSAVPEEIPDYQEDDASPVPG